MDASAGRPMRFDSPSDAHVVRFYDEQESLLAEVSSFLVAGLAKGDSSVVIATRPHIVEIEERLAARGLDLGLARAESRYAAFDAATLLAQFTVNGELDEDLFRDVVGGLVRRRIEAAPGRRLRAFGEMVALLAARGEHRSAARVEALWNDLSGRLRFSLLCAYPMGSFRVAADQAAFRDICRHHTRVIPAESYSDLPFGTARLREVAALQQSATALASEIGERRRAEDALRERSEMLDAVVEASPLPVVVIDPDTKVRVWNRAAANVFGWSAADVLGNPIPIVPVEKRGECASLCAAVSGGESFSGVETERTRRDGTRLDVRISAAPLTDAGGAVRQIVLLFEDVTERNRVRESERRALLEAESANRAKDEFLAMLGHELRNPLAAVRNAIDLATLDGARRTRALEIARRQAEHLSHLVDDLLDVARVTRGTFSLNRKAISFASVVERALDAVRPLVEERAHRIAVDLGDAGVHVRADPVRLEQIVVNLVSNAARYTDPGGRLEVIAESSGDEVALTVRDDGIGIAPEMLPRIFDLFVQGERTLDRAPGGLGVGLTLARRLAELHGGRIEARSGGVGRGAEFILRLPALPAAEPEDREESPAAVVPKGSARVLVVEDNADAAESLRMLLEVLGHRARIAGDGATAIDAARADVPDVILVDIGLPGMNGYEVARRIRLDPELKGVFLVALTGYGRDEDKRDAERAGFDQHLVKPIDVATLQAIVARFAGTSRSARLP